MSKPIAVIISDVHYSLTNLEVADKCLRQAIDKANDLEVPLVIAGDLHDTKANLRGECVKAMLDTIEECKDRVIILRGNHDAINEKSTAHSLDFLRLSAEIVTHPYNDLALGVTFVPYQHDAENMRAILRTIPTGSRLIIHQGHHGALPGGYSFDRSALSAADYAPFKVISGHYHQHQTFGDFTYIGNPYTLDFSEANHPEKGFIILNDEFSIIRVPTNVRKHVVMEMSSGLLLQYDLKFTTEDDAAPEDILLVRISGFRSELAHMTKAFVEKRLGRSNFRLDLIPTDSEVSTITTTPNQSVTEVYYSVVQAQTLSDDEKAKVKALWKDPK